MKKILLVALALMLTICTAMADEVINAKENRGIVLNEVGVNPVIEGESPTTGLTLNEINAPSYNSGLVNTGRYMPVLVQIDNADGGRGFRAPWGAEFVDIVYESPLYLLSKAKHGIETRISFLFSDVIPDAVGPVRSARVGHAWLREEWDCGFIFYGQQTYEGTNVLSVFESTGADKKNVLFSGIVGSGKPWKKFYSVRKGLASPHDKSANAAAMVELIPAAHTAPNHTFLFTDEAASGDPAAHVDVSWGSSIYDSRLVYNADRDGYIRYMNDGMSLNAYVDFDTQEPLLFRNVIIQHTATEFPRVDAPVTQVVGEGNADFFMNGVHVAGYWKRADMSSRTVYYDMDGNEMKLQRGKSLIVLLPLENSVSYGAGE